MNWLTYEVGKWEEVLSGRDVESRHREQKRTKKEQKIKQWNERRKRDKAKTTQKREKTKKERKQLGAWRLWGLLAGCPICLLLLSALETLGMSIVMTHCWNPRSLRSLQREIDPTKPQILRKQNGMERHFVVTFSKCICLICHSAIAIHPAKKWIEKQKGEGTKISVIRTAVIVLATHFKSKIRHQKALFQVSPLILKNKKSFYEGENGI